jgi:hypothetical protein
VTVFSGARTSLVESVNIAAGNNEVAADFGNDR